MTVGELIKALLDECPSLDAKVSIEIPPVDVDLDPVEAALERVEGTFYANRVVIFGEPTSVQS